MGLTNILKKAISTLRSHLRQVLLFSLVLLSIFIVYGNDLSILINEALQNDALTYMLLMPFFAGYLFYQKKALLQASLALEKNRKQKTEKYVNEVLAVILCLLAFLFYWYGSYTFYPLELHLLSLPLFVAGVTLFLLNSQALRILLFPILFLLFLVPIPATILQTVGGALANFNTQTSYTILKALGIPLTLSTAYGAPTVLLTSAAGKPVNFTVDVSCSGVYSLITFAMFASFIAFISFTSAFKKSLVFTVGFVVFAALNLIRIMGILSFSYLLGEQTALIAHALSGFALIFTGMVLVLTISERILKIQIKRALNTQTPEHQLCPLCKPKLEKLKGFCNYCGRYITGQKSLLSKKFLAKILLLLLGVTIAVYSIRAPTFATIQNLLQFTSITDPQSADTNPLPEIPGYTLSFLYRDTRYEKIAEQDATLVYGYFPPSNSSKHEFYADIGISGSLSNLHNWEFCWITMQTSQGQYPIANVHDSKDIQLIENPPLVSHFLVFERPDGYTQATIYWYEKALYKTGLTIEPKYVRISLIVLAKNLIDVAAVEGELLTAGLHISEAWEPFKTQALISLGVPAQQVLLVSSLVFVITTKSGQYWVKRRRALNNLCVFKNYAPQKEKIVLSVLQELSKEKKYVRTNDVLESLQKRVGHSVNSKRVLHILKRLEAQGFIERTIVSIRNAPLLVWKSKLP